jgi:hypothetical protein
VQIAHEHKLEQPKPAYVQRPIVGKPKNQDTPTSGDVHLFKDPSTYHTDRPCFYADCEGLDGGSKLPIGERKILNIKKAVGEFKISRPREIKLRWAVKEKLSREWMVGNFYPRVLFTFSDIVCYVTKNFR